MRLEDLPAGTHPILCPGDVVFLFDLVVVLVVLVADIERRVGKDKIRKRLADFTQNLNTIAANYPVQKLLHSDILEISAGFARYDMQDNQFYANPGIEGTVKASHQFYRTYQAHKKGRPRKTSLLL